MKFVRGSKPDRLSAQAWLAAYKADQLHKRIAGREVEITSCTEGKHSVARSSHYRGDAIDIRIWYLTDAANFVKRLKLSLGTDYVVILEETHIHVHWSPVYHESRDSMHYKLAA